MMAMEEQGESLIYSTLSCTDYWKAILYLSDYIIQNKSYYYHLLQEVRTKDNWEGWMLYILKGVEETALETIVQIKAIQKLCTQTQEKVKKDALNRMTKN